MKNHILKLTVILSLLFMLFIPFSAYAASSGTCGDNLIWVLDDEGVLTISGNGPMEDYGWGERPWLYESNINKVVIENGVTSVGDNAFYEMEQISDVSLPETLKSIGSWAFTWCSALKEISLPDSLIGIGGFAFSGCGFESISIPDSVTSLSEYCFAYSGIKTIYIPKTVRDIKEGAFDCCSSLTEVYYSGSEKDWNRIATDNTHNSNMYLIQANKIYNYTKESFIKVGIVHAQSTTNSLKFISQVNITGQPEIVTFGTTFIPLWLFNEGSTDVATVEYDNAQYNISNGQTFGATLTDIPESYFDTYIVGKSFVKDGNGDYVWSEAKAASINDTELTEVE